MKKVLLLEDDAVLFPTHPTIYPFFATIAH